MLSIIKHSRWLLAVFLILVTSQAVAHGMSEAEKQIIIEGGNLRYIWIGATHMLSGYDHLAFVFGIIFFLTKFRDIVKYITAFTVGHSITLIAGSGHGHSHGQSQKAISDKEAASKASEIVSELANTKKIDASWKKIKAFNVEQKTFSHDPEWVISFKNDKIKDTSKRTLYVFLSLGGDYIAANYTGN